MRQFCFLYETGVLASYKQNTLLEETGFLGSANIFCDSLIASMV